MDKYFVHAIILTLVPAVLMSVVAGVCVLLIAHWPAVFLWVIIASLYATAICPLLAMLALLRVKQVKISLFEIIVSVAASLVAVALFNVALKCGIQNISGRHLSSAAGRALWFNVIGWVIGIFTLLHFVSALPDET
jgi:hypothetical protein